MRMICIVNWEILRALSLYRLIARDSYFGGPVSSNARLTRLSALPIRLAHGVYTDVFLVRHNRFVYFKKA
jgi:hypothetical protein